MPQYSNSKIECFENCPKRFKFRYIDKIKLPDSPEGIEAFLGSRVHETLEELYKNQKMNKILSLTEVLEYFKKIWDKKWNENIKIVREQYKPEDYFNAGVKQITDYYEKYKPFDQAYTIGTEVRISFDIDPDRSYKMTGFIDRLSYDGKGRYEIHDYKTGQSGMTQAQADSSKQLAIYQIYVEENYPDAKEILLVWHYMAENREVVSKRTRQQLDELKKELFRSIATIESETEFLPLESSLCNWCEYVEICPAKKHGTMLDKMDKNEYLNDTGLMLVDKYAKQYTLFDDIEEDLEEIKEAIIAYAAKEHISVVMGNYNRVTVKIEDKTHFPTKSEEGRAELEQLIKSLNKWEDVSDLSTVQLQKIYMEWNKNDIEKIKKYLQPYHRESVSRPYKLIPED